MKYYDNFPADRFKSAEAIGKHADTVFRAECHKRGLNPETAIAAPIASLVGSPICEVTAMNREQILNLWHQGLTRPEIIALGTSYAQFQNAIKQARAVGDSRAYYRNGSKTRLPWQIDITGPAKRKAKEHRIVSNPVERQTMEKNKPPFTPGPKRTLGDMGPAFVGRLVDDLVAVLPQIDQAKLELDKRFVPKSDILRSEIREKGLK